MSGSGREAIRKMFLDEVGKSMNGDQRKKLEEIIDNKSLTKQQMKDNVKSFCEGIGGDCQVSPLSPRVKTSCLEISDKTQ